MPSQPVLLGTKLITNATVCLPFPFTVNNNSNKNMLSAVDYDQDANKYSFIMTPDKPQMKYNRKHRY